MPAKVKIGSVKKSTRGKSVHPTIGKMADGFVEAFKDAEPGQEIEGVRTDILGFDGSEAQKLRSLKGDAVASLAACVSDRLGRKVAASDKIDGGNAVVYKRKSKKHGTEEVTRTSLHLVKEQGKKSEEDSDN